MANKPDWADSPKPVSIDGTLEALQLIIPKVERLTFYEDVDGNLHAEWFTRKGGFAWVNADNLEQAIIKVQEKVL